MSQRVCVLSIYDMLFGHNLELAEEAINKYKITSPSSLTDVIEIFHIKKLIDNNYRLTKWTHEEYAKLVDDTRGYSDIIVLFFRKMEVDKILDNYNTLEWGYKQSFWDIIDLYKMYDVVPAVIFKNMAVDLNNLKLIIHCKGLVERYQDIIKEILLNDSNSAQFLIEKYISRRNNYNTDRDIFLPSNLTMEDKEYIINNYLDSEKPNLNYIRLICQNKDCQNGLSFNPLTKIKAEKLEEKLNDELLKDERTIIIQDKIGIKYSHSDNLPPCSFQYKNGCPTYIYSVNFIKQCNHTQLLLNCVNMFEWMNQHFLIDLISKSIEVETLESVAFDMSRNAYPDFRLFTRKNELACYQLHGYCDVLSLMGTSFEEEIKIFYEERLNNIYGFTGLKLNYPYQADSWLNKCRVLFPELDSVVKQYNTFVDYDIVNTDIIRLSKPLKIIDGKSLLINKYYEIGDDSPELCRILRCMFASGSLLHHVEPYKDSSYRCLYDLLCHEKVNYNKYEEFQKKDLDFLIEQKIIKKSEEGGLKIENEEQAVALQSLWEYGACAYWHYGDDGRNALDEMLAKKWLLKSDKLLTTEERRYFSYYLDNSEFTNGYAYRNHYAHGSTPTTDNEISHQIAYLVLLRLLALLVLKIEDDLWSASRALSIGLTNYLHKDMDIQ